MTTIEEHGFQQQQQQQEHKGSEVNKQLELEQVRAMLTHITNNYRPISHNAPISNNSSGGNTSARKPVTRSDNLALTAGHAAKATPHQKNYRSTPEDVLTDSTNIATAVSSKLLRRERRATTDVPAATLQQKKNPVNSSSSRKRHHRKDSSEDAENIPIRYDTTTSNAAQQQQRHASGQIKTKTQGRVTVTRAATVTQAQPTAARKPSSKGNTLLHSTAMTTIHKTSNTKELAVSLEPPPRRPAAPARSKLTVPHSPMLRSKQRSAVHRRHQETKTSEQLELEEIERAKKEAAALRRRNNRTMAATAAPPASRAAASKSTVATGAPKRRALTEPKEPRLRTAKRQRLHTMSTRSMLTTSQPSPWKSTAQHVAAFSSRGPSAIPAPRKPRSAANTATARGNRRQRLTMPKTPKFRTTTRARPSRFKPSEEMEAEEAAAHRRFKARPVSKKVLEGNPVPRPQPRGPDIKKALTVPAPFSFATDARAERRAEQQKHVAAPELPPPFVFGAGSGDGAALVTRSRARAVAQSTRIEDSELPIQANPADFVDPGDYLQGSSSLSGIAMGSHSTHRRRATRGSMLLGGAVRVLQPRQAEEGHDNNNDSRTSSDHVSNTVHPPQTVTYENRAFMMPHHREQENEAPGGHEEERGGVTAGRSTRMNPLYQA